MRSRRDVAALMSDGTAVDRALQSAFADAVRRHREAGVPMAMWEDGAVKMVSPFDVPLPEEEVRADGASAEGPVRRAQAGD
jgi:hypothetical protein